MDKAQGYGAALSLLIMVTMGPGCAGPSGYIRLTEAGVAYSDAVVALNDKASELSVDASSWTLLDENRCPAKKREECLTRYSESDKAAIKQNAAAKRVALYLKSYFATLLLLAGSEAPGEIGKATDGLAKNLTTAIKEAGGSASVPAQTGAVAEALVRWTRDRALERELRRRKETISAAMEILGGIVASQAEGISTNVGKAGDREYIALVKKKYEQGALTTDAKQKTWRADRRRHLLEPLRVVEVGQVVVAAESFRASFEAMTGPGGGAVDVARLQELTNDLVTISKFIDAL